MGALAGKLADIGINDQFMKDLSAPSRRQFRALRARAQGDTR